MFKKSLVLLAVVGSALPAVSFAEEASPLSFNIGAVSDYRYRGISQSRLKPALQGGLDYAIPGGFYIGAWASTIKWIKDAGGDSKVEIDVYGATRARSPRIWPSTWARCAISTPATNRLFNPPPTTSGDDHENGDCHRQAVQA